VTSLNICDHLRRLAMLRFRIQCSRPIVPISLCVDDKMLRTTDGGISLMRKCPLQHLGVSILKHAFRDDSNAWSSMVNPVWV